MGWRSTEVGLNFRIIGMALASAREELETVYTASFITICLLGCIICLVGVTMVAIPIGIISSSFINIVQKKKQNLEKENDSQ